MKLAWLGVLLALVAALAAWLWWRDAPNSTSAARPTITSSTPATPLAQEPSAPDATLASAELPTAAREEVVASDASSKRETALLRTIVKSKETGAPVAGVRLAILQPGASARIQWVDGPHGELGLGVRTDENGRAEFAVEAGASLLLSSYDVRYPNAHQDVEPLNANETRLVTLTLATEEDAVFRGRVVDDDGGAPLASARIKLGRQDSRYMYRGGTARLGSDDVPPRNKLDEDAFTVDPDGCFEVRYKSWLSRVAFAYAEGYSLAIFVIERGDDAGERALELRLARTATVDAVVRESSGAVEGVVVDLSIAASRLEQGPDKTNFFGQTDHHWSAITDLNGRARITDVSPRLPLTLNVRSSKRAPQPQTETLVLAPGEHRDLALTLDSGAVVGGRLEDGEGQPVREWAIWRLPAQDSGASWLRGGSAPVATVKTDEAGRFRFEDVPLGSWSIGPAPGSSDRDVDAGRDFAGLAQVVDVRTPGDQLDVTLRVDRGLFLRGTVVDSTGAPAASWVIAGLGSGFAAADCRSDGQGRFELGPLPSGEWRLRAHAVLNDHAPSEELRVQAGTDGIELKLRDGATVSGKVVDRQTRVPTPCDLQVTSLDDDFGMEWFESLDGSFRSRGKLLGTYVLSASTQDGRCGHRRVTVGVGETLDDVEIVLDLGAKLALRYTGEQSCDCDVINGGEIVTHTEFEKGGTSTCVVPVGSLALHWKNDATKFEETQTVTLAAGERRELTWKGEP